MVAGFTSERWPASCRNKWPASSEYALRHPENPAYAGAFVYGRTRSCQAHYPGGKLKTQRRPISDWKIVVKDRYPAYVEWDGFERIHAMLRDNYAEYQRSKTRGVPRDGAAVLQGIVWCGQCGHKMAVQYKDGNRYVCNAFSRAQGGPLCQHLSADLIDARVVDAFLGAIGPSELEAWKQARNAKLETRDATRRAEAQQLERLRYQALLAERQYNRVDPDNRLIAGELERRWEMALRELRQAEDAFARHEADARAPDMVSDEDQSSFLELGSRLPEIWQRTELRREDKKALLRSLIDKVILHRVTRDSISIRVVWRGGEVSQMEVQPRVHTLSALSRSTEMEVRLLELASQGVDDITIAKILTEEGHRSARCNHVPARTVQIVRQRHRVLYNARDIRQRHISGWLTIATVAQMLNVSDSWIKRRIRNHTIEIERDPRDKRFLFPDTPEGMAALQELKSGARNHLVVAPRANK